jgi:hypothetical protein
MNLIGQTFIRGIEIANGRFIINTQAPGLDIETQPHTGFCYWTREGGWAEIGIAGKLTADSSANEDGSAMIMMDPTGFMHEVDGNQITKDFLKDCDGNIPGAPLRCIRCIDGQVYAAGVERQVFRRSGGTWQVISPKEIMTADHPIAFQGIDGVSSCEIYAVGWDGEIWSFDGIDWQQLQSPTNIVLNDVGVGPDGCVAVGLLGQVIAGRGDSWTMIEHDETDEDFWSVRYFDGAFYLAALSGIYRLLDGKLTMFRETDADMRTAYSLSVGPSGLWSVGANDIALFNGADWETIAQS